MSGIRIAITLASVFAVFLTACQKDVPTAENSSSMDTRETAEVGAEESRLRSDERPALPFPPGVSLESQCGAVNDQQDVERYDGTLGVTREYTDVHELSTVQFQWLESFDIEDKLGVGFNSGNVGGERWCTGTLISDRRVLTAGHCFDIQENILGWVSPFKQLPDGDREPVSPGVIAKLQQANFNYQKNGATGVVRPGISFRIDKLVEYRLGGLDYAIVELATAPSHPEIDIASVENRVPENGEKIAIIQHPQGKPKKIDAGSILESTGDAIWYGNLDTHGGSSGSGVRDRDGEVIGVHTNGGCTVSGGANRGVTITAIRDASNEI